MVDTKRKVAASEEWKPLVSISDSSSDKKNDGSKTEKNSLMQLSKAQKVVLGMILWVLVIGFLVLGGNSVLQMEDPTPQPSFRPTTVAPTPSPSSSPTTSVPTFAPTSREAYVKTTLRTFFAHKADFTHTKAYQWMIETDTFQPEEERMVLERFVLAHLYFELNGHGWKFNPSWLTSKSICDWHRKETYDKEFLGARCNSDNTATTHIDLAENDLKGSLPTELAMLTGLSYLNLYQNSVHSSIPTAIGKLTRLQEIELGHNEFTGRIPSEIGHLIALSTLNMPWNQLTSTIPTEIGELTTLTRLSFAWNQLTGEVPILSRSILDCWLYKNNFVDTTNGVHIGCHL